jgi:hypothetical protein
MDYRNPTKDKVRSIIWTTAVRGLCKERHDHVILHENLISELWHRATHDARTFGYRSDPAILRDFIDSIRVSNGEKKPGDLRVLYLAGPSPLNDLRIALDEGVRIENIWAVESDANLYAKGRDSLIAHYPNLNSYHSRLLTF